MSETPDNPAVEADEHAETQVLTGDEVSGAEPMGDLETALAESEGHRNDHLRALADIDNLRKRTQRELENARKYGLERLASELLPVRDSLEAGIVSAEGQGSVNALLEGAQATLKLLDAALAQFSIEVIDPHGEPFDPQYHEALSIVDAPDTEPNSVVTVVQKGFRIHERLLRPARVLVSKPPGN
jgi:molecular chaperone GrpE